MIGIIYLQYDGWTTYTAHAIEKVVRDDFNGPRSRYPKARRIMILLTDGNSTDKEWVYHFDYIIEIRYEIKCNVIFADTRVTVDVVRGNDS